MQFNKIKIDNSNKMLFCYILCKYIILKLDSSIKIIIQNFCQNRVLSYILFHILLNKLASDKFDCG